VAFGAAGTAELCFGPFSAQLGTGITVVRSAEMSGGMPMSSTDASALQGTQWALNAPIDGVTAPCQADFTITNVSFVTGP